MRMSSALANPDGKEGWEVDPHVYTVFYPRDGYHFWREVNKDETLKSLFREKGHGAKRRFMQAVEEYCFNAMFQNNSYGFKVGRYETYLEEQLEERVNAFNQTKKTKKVMTGDIIMVTWEGDSTYKCTVDRRGCKGTEVKIVSEEFAGELVIDLFLDEWSFDPEGLKAEKERKTTMKMAKEKEEEKEEDKVEGGGDDELIL